MAMRSKLIAALLATCGLFVAAQTLVAHHAGTMFDEDKTTELTGTIKEFQFTNPHAWIQVMVETKPGEAPKEWSVEWGSPNQLSRQGIRPSTFKAGSKVTMRVHPMRDGSAAGNFVAAKFEDGKIVGRWE
ncbi:MAG: DUF6152 family protein [Vicinamibacterales bacterium]|nr:DUF6152 family protein [Vicinamibacterales bacterium]